MRKTLTAVAVSLITVASYGQSIYDGFNFSQNDYQGSARTIAMGNAFTAIGGDLGSIGINPAGSAVSNFSQITLTPSVSLSTTTNAYTPVYGKPYAASFNDSYARPMIPNIGVNLNYETGQNYGLKNVTFGIISNVTQDYTMSMFTQGQNNKTTMTGAFATAAAGIDNRNLTGDAAFDKSPWQSVTAYQGGLISNYGGYTNDYIGAAEGLFSDGTIALAGPINQAYTAMRYGSKYDFIINTGLNFNDRWYLGANLGITGLSYTYKDEVAETPVNENDFAIDFDGRTTNFLGAKNRYFYNAEGAGLYLKVGFIGTPVAGLRIGAAIQTPTAIDIVEKYQYGSETKFSTSTFNASASSPLGQYEYRLRTPFRANAGIAYNILGLAMISADYEFCNYSGMRFKSSEEIWDGLPSDDFITTNNEIKNYAGVQHMLRVGAEVKLLPEMALRAGYNYMTSPEYYYEDYTKKNVKSPTSAFSFGMGYSSTGAFFADVACKVTKMPTSYVQIYDDYLVDDGMVESDKVYSPEIRRTGSLINIVATVGLRF